jgi:hypothetical protein
MNNRMSAFNKASPAERSVIISALTDTQSYKKPMGPKRQATAAQLAALTKARAARAGKVSSARTGKVLTATNKIVKAVNEIVTSSNPSAFNSASPAERALMISNLTDTLNYKKPMGPKRQATAAQLAALAKGRAARAEKKNANFRIS